MSDNPFLIMPPPGLLPPVPEPEPAAAAPESAEMIELPAQFVTGTRKMAPSRGVETAVAPAILAPSFPLPAAHPEAPGSVDADAVSPEPITPESVTTEPVTPEPVTPEHLTPTAATPAAHWRLLLQGGVPAISLAGPVILGRKPASIAEYPTATLVAVSDLTRTVSSSHALFGVDATGLWLADLDSTNGSAVTTPTGVRATIDPAAPVYLESGSILEFGEFRATLDFS